MELGKDITFVSFCVDIGRGSESVDIRVRRDVALYRQGMDDNINSVLPMVIYTSEEVGPIPAHRNESNLLIRKFTTENLEQEFPNFELFRNAYEYTFKDFIESNIFYYNPLVVMKMKKIVDIINENPFGSEYFFWVDSYFNRGMENTSGFLYDEEIHKQKCKNIMEKTKDKMVLFSAYDRPYGFFWGGHRDAIKKVHDLYFDVYFDSLDKKLLTEELVFKQIYSTNPELFDFVEITHYQQRYKTAVSEYFNLCDGCI